jgi:hypothetical protein
MGTFKTFGALYDLLADAIIKQEGRPADDPDPGDIRGAPWLPSSALVKYRTLGASGKFWVPGSRLEGVAAIYHVAALHTSELNTLQQFVYTWAPPSENNSVVYLTNVMQWTGIQDATVPLYTLVVPQ